MSTFAERMDELGEQVGRGLIEGIVTVDQVYAHYQDSGVGPRGTPAEAFEHPRGGEAGYLSKSLDAMGPSFAQKIADSIGDEVPMVDVFVEGVQDLSEQVAIKAPMEYGNLRESSAASVVDNGDTVFDRPPLVPRLDEDALKKLKRAAKEYHRAAP